MDTENEDISLVDIVITPIVDLMVIDGY